MRAWLQGKTDITLLYTILLQSDAMATIFFFCLFECGYYLRAAFISLRSVQLPYSGKLLREKTFHESVKKGFSRRKLPQIAHFCHSKGHHTSTFCGENFREWPQNCKIRFLPRKFPAIQYYLRAASNRRNAAHVHVICKEHEED